MRWRLLALLNVAILLAGVWSLVVAPGAPADTSPVPAPSVLPAPSAASGPAPVEGPPGWRPDHPAVRPWEGLDPAPLPPDVDWSALAADIERAEVDRQAAALARLQGGSAALRAEVEALLAGLPADLRVAVHVTDEAGGTVASRDADVPVLPASTQKLVAAAAALAQLGPEHRYTTVLRATAAPGPDGSLSGDLVLVGAGDPVLATPTFGGIDPARPRTPLEALADQLVAAGVRHVRGRVVGDASVLPHEPRAEGWLDRYLTSLDTTLSSGLTVDAGRRLFVEGGRLRGEASADPAAEAAASLVSLLAERGVAVDGGPAAATEPQAAPYEVGRVQSPPLVELLRHAVQRSDNQITDAVFRTVGASVGDGSWAGSARAARQVLAPLRLDWAGARVADGSGLSREDRLTARFLTGLDRGLLASNHGAEWRSLMAVSGERGTLRRRLTGTIAAGRLVGKTGTLKDVRSLVGHVEGPAGSDRRYHLAVLGNALTAEQNQLVRDLTDRLAILLAADLYGCTRVLVEPTTAPPADPAAPPASPAAPVETWVCAA